MDSNYSVHDRLPSDVPGKSTVLDLQKEIRARLQNGIKDKMLAKSTVKAESDQVFEKQEMVMETID